ncbi:predicted protein [Sclerotinia sclerotiorum 1980 UF-70]|uniref:Uncharacterized protein n=1 Tax=Sclerotinia sclerotiorum (strain ATCC 18683 / 1980 / Ss-1) TaxID=665079 RepID=A7E6I1_SCLS1|nr:predicted protein [Sclerotinia sclerotiorum 1980 UF-70]EDN91503.1 predicted protein [Sclerotinia sclerotiorum 1980 UF-70]
MTVNGCTEQLSSPADLRAKSHSWARYGTGYVVLNMYARYMGIVGQWLRTLRTEGRSADNLSTVNRDLRIRSNKIESI